MTTTERIASLAQARADVENLQQNGHSGGESFSRADFWQWAKDTVTRFKDDPAWLDEIQESLIGMWDDAQQEFPAGVGANEDGSE